jgi:pSer/pThr/pTyr-binding forkhead associated (FHA) protein
LFTQILKNNSLISIGDSYFSVTFGNVGEETITQTDTSNMINIKVLSKDVKYVPLYIAKSNLRNFQPSKTAIRIGRSNDCEVIINDNMLSRFHCFIEYNEIVGWIIKDGYIVKNKSLYEHYSSTNGTWYNNGY